jgi:hypothetical protein
MDFEDILEPEVAAAAAVTAVIASPQVRKVVRRGAVYGLAGLLVAGDAISSFSKGVGRGIQRATVPAGAKAGAASDGTSGEYVETQGAGEGDGR